MDETSVTRMSLREIEDMIILDVAGRLSPEAKKEHTKFLRRRHKARCEVDRLLDRLALEQLEALSALIKSWNKF